MAPGLGWQEHDAELFEGIERGFRPGYNANLVSSWIPRLMASTPNCDVVQRSRMSVAPCALDHSARSGVPQFDIRRVRLPRTVDP